MSLIHDALKKAQDKEKAPIGSGLTSFQDSPQSKHKTLPKRTIVLIALIVVALGFLAYKRFSKPKTSAPPPPAATAAGQAGQSLAPRTAGQTPGGDGLLMKRRAIEAFRTDDLDAALASISQAAQLTPNDPEVWNDKGLIEKKLGSLDGARQSYQKALQLKPEYPEAINNMAMLELAEGNPSKARELLQKALGLVPAYPEANFNLAVLYDGADDKKQALEFYKRFLDVSGAFPSNVVEAVRDRVMEIEP